MNNDNTVRLVGGPSNAPFETTIDEFRQRIYIPDTSTRSLVYDYVSEGEPDEGALYEYRGEDEQDPRLCPRR